ncbi:DNA-binding protein [Ancylomarina salipaludis]|uniref:DNA-binding protein n=1 Tax=Ancylomarina salipaludis TaxID=2501299 RepID=A0A4Q1JJR9_9BACT|nr:helix-turn-helix domain-containing protein [Ancylomarina salipaludis]RXQ89484.1 DNA-binding protein [Ancylomarina salipaludis]
MSSNIQIMRICQFCGKEFLAKTTVTKHCSDPCRKRAYKARKKNEKIEASNKATNELKQKPLIDIQHKEYLSLKETCFLLGISRTSLWRVIKEGNLNVGKIGGKIIIPKSSIKELFLQI